MSEAILLAKVPVGCLKPLVWVLAGLANHPCVEWAKREKHDDNRQEDRGLWPVGEESTHRSGSV